MDPDPALCIFDRQCLSVLVEWTGVFLRDSGFDVGPVSILSTDNYLCSPRLTTTVPYSKAVSFQISSFSPRTFTRSTTCQSEWHSSSVSVPNPFTLMSSAKAISYELPCRSDHQLLGYWSAGDERCRRSSGMAVDVPDRVSLYSYSADDTADAFAGVSLLFASVSHLSGLCPLPLPRPERSIVRMDTLPSERKRSSLTGLSEMTQER